VVMPGHEIMTELMGPQDQQESEGKRDSLPDILRFFQGVHTLLHGTGNECCKNGCHKERQGDEGLQAILESFLRESCVKWIFHVYRFTA